MSTIQRFLRRRERHNKESRRTKEEVLSSNSVHSLLFTNVFVPSEFEDYLAFALPWWFVLRPSSRG